jgi:hypothetical protein
MTNPIRTIEYVLIALMAYQLVRLWWRLNRRRMETWWQRVKDHHPRQRHPKSPKDCPHCCRGVRLETARIKWEVKPWGEVKSTRGRKKKYATQGYACLNPACAYFGHTDERMHALVRHTTRGKTRTFRIYVVRRVRRSFPVGRARRSTTSRRNQSAWRWSCGSWPKGSITP